MCDAADKAHDKLLFWQMQKRKQDLASVMQLQYWHTVSRAVGVYSVASDFCGVRKPSRAPYNFDVTVGLLACVCRRGDADVRHKFGHALLAQVAVCVFHC